MIEGPEGSLLLILSGEELRRIHETSLKVLEDVGVNSDSHVILKTFSDAGADADAWEALEEGRKRAVKLQRGM